MSRVLLVDDKEDNIYYLSALLRGHGWEVETARHGADALDKAHAHAPDLVISDLLMPVMDGYTLLRHWKSDPQLRAVPFIVYTATYTDADDEQLARNLGADAFILKPSEPEPFVAEVRRAEATAARAPIAPAEKPGSGDERMREYSEVLIRKLEEKMVQLEDSNRLLQRDIAARELAETTLRRTEEQLRQAQKLEAVGRLAGGVAHDFNNLLSVILSYAEILLEELPAQDPSRTEVEEIRHAGQRATELTRQLLAFSRQQVLQPRVLVLSTVVIAMEKMVKRLLGADIEVVLQMGRPAGRVYADASQLEQILMNLVVNARDAMPHGGKLTIETRVVELDAGARVMLAVTDTGTGMDATVRAHIFEPFFTTKAKGKGTGLGLSTVFGIVQQSHGTITVDSEPGRGTTFAIYLPRTDRDVEETVTPAERATLRGTETILLVEDDPQLRTMTNMILQRYGYTALVAANAGEALLLCESYEREIHLLLTDVIMPLMSGRALAERLAPLRPTMRVLYVSGYAEDTIADHGVVAPGIALVTKPTTPEVLMRKLRDVLDAP